MDIIADDADVGDADCGKVLSGGTEVRGFTALNFQSVINVNGTIKNFTINTQLGDAGTISTWVADRKTGIFSGELKQKYIFDSSAPGDISSTAPKKNAFDMLMSKNPISEKQSGRKNTSSKVERVSCGERISSRPQVMIIHRRSEKCRQANVQEVVDEEEVFVSSDIDSAGVSTETATRKQQCAKRKRYT